MMFRIVVLGAMDNLSDDRIEFMIRDRWASRSSAATPTKQRYGPVRAAWTRGAVLLDTQERIPNDGVNRAAMEMGGIPGSGGYPIGPRSVGSSCARWTAAIHVFSFSDARARDGLGATACLVFPLAAQRNSQWDKAVEERETREFGIHGGVHPGIRRSSACMGSLDSGIAENVDAGIPGNDSTRSCRGDRTCFGSGDARNRLVT